MKKILLITAILVGLFTSCKQEPTFRIYGTMDSTSCDGAQIFLFPANGPQTSQTVDSVSIRDSNFYFEGTTDQMAILSIEI